MPKKEKISEWNIDYNRFFATLVFPQLKLTLFRFAGFYRKQLFYLQSSNFDGLPLSKINIKTGKTAKVISNRTYLLILT